MIKRALISVSNKEGIVEFAKELSKLDVEILSTGGTAKALTKAGVKVMDVNQYTGFPEMMDGRVKTLHPKVHAGILCKRDDKMHMEEAKKNSVEMIDLVVVNLYPFEETVAGDHVDLGEAIEQIDIGGPSMLRSAAKNFKDVIVITDPKDYSNVIGHLKKKEDVPKDERARLAVKVFRRTADYDSAIDKYLSREMLGEEIFRPLFLKGTRMRYGENPHQQAKFYKDSKIIESCVASASQLHGKELSYNNILDIDAALELVKDFKEPTAAVIKHTNPCGVASGKKIEEALVRAHEVDEMSAFGSVIALNRNCNKSCADEIAKFFVEVVICPAFDKDALEILQKKKNIRLLEVGKFTKSDSGYDLKKVSGGVLVQTRAFPKAEALQLKVVTKRKPTAKEMEDLLFAWIVNKHTKSNSVLFVKDKCAVGLGVGQMSRVDSSIIAARKAGDRAKGSVMSSDAFFPFRDGVDEAAKAGITAIIQPGGSIRDQEVIDAADEHSIAMVFSGVRLFRH